MDGWTLELLVCQSWYEAVVEAPLFESLPKFVFRDVVDDVLLVDPL